MDERFANSLAEAIRSILTGGPWIVAGKEVSLETPDDQLNTKQREELVRFVVGRVREVWKSS